MKIQYPMMAALAAFVGCSQYIPSVGPNYEEPKFAELDFRAPDAGLPTTNLTATGEYRPAAAEADSRAVISKEKLAQWWTQFDDPVLTQLVGSAVTNNLNYQMAVWRLEQSSYELLGSYAAFMPKFALGGSWARQWFNENNVSGGGVKNQYNVQQATLDAAWEIDIFGGRRRNSEAAWALWQAAGLGVDDAWVALTTQIGQNYIQLRTTQERLGVARTNLKLQAETYAILKSRLDSGIGDELAVNQCAYIVEQTRAKIPTMLAQEEALKNALTILAGEVPGALDELLKPVAKPRDWLLEPQKIAALPLNMLRARPDVRRAERQLAAQTAYIGVAKAQWFPKLTLSGSVGWQSKNGARLFDADSFLASLGPSVSWPILQGGAIYANVKATEAKTEQLALAYALAIETAYGEVRDNYAAYTQEYHRYKALTSAVKAATDAVTISQDLYKNGLKDFNNVLDAQRSRLQLEEEFVISRGLISQNLIKLYRALGAGLAAAE